MFFCSAGAEPGRSPRKRGFLFVPLHGTGRFLRGRATRRGAVLMSRWCDRFAGTARPRPAVPFCAGRKEPRGPGARSSRGYRSLQRCNTDAPTHRAQTQKRARFRAHGTKKHALPQGKQHWDESASHTSWCHPNSKGPSVLSFFSPSFAGGNPQTSPSPARAPSSLRRRRGLQPLAPFSVPGETKVLLRRRGGNVFIIVALFAPVNAHGPEKAVFFFVFSLLPDPGPFIFCCSSD